MFEGTLKNGLRYLVSREKGELASILVLIGVGSRDEPKDKAGISHFLEHMIFKGSKGRPDNVAVFKVFDAIGAEFNAFTARDQTGYYAKFYKDHFKTVLNTIADIVLNPLLDSRDIKKEKTVVYEEIDMIQDDPDLLALEKFEEKIFGSHPLGNSVAGYKKTIKNLKKDDLKDYHERYYCPSNTIVILTGELPKKEEILGILKKNFNSDWTDYGCQVYAPKKYASERDQPLILVHNVKTDQEHFVVGFPMFGYYDQRKYAAEVLNVIVGATFTSRLFVEAREKRGLVYNIRSSVRLYEEGGFFYIRTFTNKKNFVELFKVILKVLKEVKKKPISAQELKEAKTHLEGTVYIKEIDVLNLALLYGVQKLYRKGDVLTYKEIIKHVKKVTAKQVQEVAREIFDFNKMVISLVGETKKKTIKDAL